MNEHITVDTFLLYLPTISNDSKKQTLYSAELYRAERSSDDVFQSDAGWWIIELPTFSGDGRVLFSIISDTIVISFSLLSISVILLTEGGTVPNVRDGRHSGYRDTVYVIAAPVTQYPQAELRGGLENKLSSLNLCPRYRTRSHNIGNDECEVFQPALRVRGYSCTSF
jgi:hypothetical protein